MKHKFSFITLSLQVLFLMTTSIFAQKNEPDKKQVKPALLVIDIQNEFLKYMSEDDKKLGMEVINGAIWTFRQHNLPIIRVYHTDPNWGPKPGAEPFEFPKSVHIKDDDPQVIKNFPSAFQKTDLDKILKEKECNTLFLCGLSSVGCVLATYFGGMERDYKVFMVKEGIMSHNSEYTRVIRDICETVSFDTMVFILEQIK
jgi:nicotinamidase-related amidase